MKITSLSAQVRNPNRVNVSVDGKYRFSLDIFQVGELGLKVGKEYTEAELEALEEESAFGKLYARALEYTMLRPHSTKEIRDYLWKKTLSKKIRSKKTGELYERKGVSKEITERVLKRLIEKNYVNDRVFAEWWFENRNIQKGTSRRKMYNELLSKGVSKEVIEDIVQKSTRDEKSELAKVIAKKSSRYTDEKKFMAYLLRQGFDYDDIKAALSEDL